jgi:hypothetical protein
MLLSLQIESNSLSLWERLGERVLVTTTVYALFSTAASL